MRAQPQPIYHSQARTLAAAIETMIDAKLAFAFEPAQDFAAARRMAAEISDSRAYLIESLSVIL